MWIETPRTVVAVDGGGTGPKATVYRTLVFEPLVGAAPGLPVKRWQKRSQKSRESDLVRLSIGLCVSSLLRLR